MVDFEGEYDMTRFFISVKMGAEGFKSLVPKKCDMRANFRFLGNKIVGRYVTVYDLPDLQTDSLKQLSDTAFMARVRPEELNQDEESIYQSYYKACRNKDTLPHKENNFVKDVLWDMVGDNILNRISQDFGKENQGYFKLSPIFNPLYMGYSERKGLVYKFDLRMQYAFDHNFLLSLQFKGGYSMRQHRFTSDCHLSLDITTCMRGISRQKWVMAIILQPIEWPGSLLIPIHRRIPSAIMSSKTII